MALPDNYPSSFREFWAGHLVSCKDTGNSFVVVRRCRRGDDGSSHPRAAATGLTAATGLPDAADLFSVRVEAVDECNMLPPS